MAQGHWLFCLLVDEHANKASKDISIFCSQGQSWTHIHIVSHGEPFLFCHTPLPTPSRHSWFPLFAFSSRWRYLHSLGFSMADHRTTRSNIPFSSLWSLISLTPHLDSSCNLWRLVLLCFLYRFFLGCTMNKLPNPSSQCDWCYLALSSKNNVPSASTCLYSDLMYNAWFGWNISQF